VGSSTRWGKENGLISSSKVRDARQAKGSSRAAAIVVVMVFLAVADLQLCTTACRSQSSVQNFGGHDIAFEVIGRRSLAALAIFIVHFLVSEVQRGFFFKGSNGSLSGPTITFSKK
jgi:hypothetical protein